MLRALLYFEELKSIKILFHKLLIKELLVKLYHIFDISYSTFLFTVKRWFVHGTERISASASPILLADRIERTDFELDMTGVFP